MFALTDARAVDTSKRRSSQEINLQIYLVQVSLANSFSLEALDGKYKVLSPLSYNLSFVIELF